MWRIGFRIWSAWQKARLAIPGLGLCAVIYLAQGISTLFVVVALITLAVLAGAGSVLTGVAEREGVTTGKETRR